jgi:putative hydrolase of the HAD superfamily
MIRIALFDLDDTLYPRGLGIMDEIRTLILTFILTRLNLTPKEADELRQRYLDQYGTTMRGLQINYQIDPEDYLAWVHDIPLQKFLEPNPCLDAVLASMTQEKVVFTNASREHAERVLGILGIGHHFTRIVDVRDLRFESKPQPAAYRRVCDIVGVPPDECLLVEDNVRNLAPAKALGMTTVLVGDGQDHSDHSVDHAITRIEQIGQVLALQT